MTTVWMRNPALPGNDPVEADEYAFEVVWRLRGWEECDPPTDPDSDTDDTDEQDETDGAPTGGPDPGDLEHEQTEDDTPDQVAPSDDTEE